MFVYMYNYEKKYHFIDLSIILLATSLFTLEFLGYSLETEVRGFFALLKYYFTFDFIITRVRILEVFLSV